MKRELILLILILFGLKTAAQTDFSEEVDAIVERSRSKAIDDPVIFIGSSSIKHWATLESDYPDFSILNHGFGGSEYSDLNLHKEQLIEEFEPSMIVVYSGDNDIANGKEPLEVAEEAEVFVDGLKRIANGAPVVVLSVKPSIARWELKDNYVQLNSRLDTLIAAMDHAVFVDVWSMMLNQNGEVNEDLFLEDGLHLNKKGYQIWKDALQPFLTK